MNKAAQALGALGGKARAKALSKQERSEIARKAGKASAAKRKGRAILGKGRIIERAELENWKACK